MNCLPIRVWKSNLIKKKVFKKSLWALKPRIRSIRVSGQVLQGFKAFLLNNIRLVLIDTQGFIISIIIRQAEVVLCHYEKLLSPGNSDGHNPLVLYP